MPYSDSALQSLATTVGSRLHETNHTLITAESCTGGGIMKIMTDIAGSSGWCEGGFVVYSNRAKQRLLGVPNTILLTDGAVSQRCVEALAVNALAYSDASIAVAVSGIAGPDGGTPSKPVGTVWLAWALTGGHMHSECHHWAGGRDLVRRQAIHCALSGLLACLDHSNS